MSRGSVRVAAAAPPGTVRSGGNSAGSPATLSWKIRTRPSRSFSRCTPRSASPAPGGRTPRTSAADASDTSTWPPCPAAATRAARCTSRPTRPAAVCDASPLWTPIRTRTCSPPGHPWARRACCIWITAATHAAGEENTAKNASPCVSTSRPPCAASPDRMIA